MTTNPARTTRAERLVIGIEHLLKHPRNDRVTDLLGPAPLRLKPLKSEDPKAVKHYIEDMNDVFAQFPVEGVDGTLKFEIVKDDSRDAEQDVAYLRPVFPMLAMPDSEYLTKLKGRIREDGPRAKKRIRHDFIDWASMIPENTIESFLSILKASKASIIVSGDTESRTECSLFSDSVPTINGPIDSLRVELPNQGDRFGQSMKRVMDQLKKSAFPDTPKEELPTIKVKDGVLSFKGPEVVERITSMLRELDTSYPAFKEARTQGMFDIPDSLAARLNTSFSSTGPLNRDRAAIKSAYAEMIGAGESAGSSLPPR